MNELMIDLLMSIGLTRQEAKCYLSLYILGEAQGGEISNKSGIATSNLYSVIENLIQKGMVSYRLQNNKKVFVASSPDVLNEFIYLKQKELDEKKKKVQTAILELKQNKVEKPQIETKYYRGLSGIKGMWYELSNTLPNIKKSEIVKIHSSKGGTYERLLGFYDLFHEERLKYNIGYHLIMDTDNKKHVEKRKRQNSKVKSVPLKNDAKWGVVGKYFFIYYLITKEPYGILIKDEKIAHTFSLMFDKIWNQ
jgi:sugar-specific transcriptional regulator TrmB